MTGPSFLHWDKLCDELLREVLPGNARKGASLKLTWLLSILCTPLLEELTIHQLQCSCRAYIMYMIGGALIPDKSGNKVYLMYLTLFTCLANLYRELCRTSSEVGKVMGGGAILLQSWAGTACLLLHQDSHDPKQLIH